MFNEVFNDSQDTKEIYVKKTLNIVHMSKKVPSSLKILKMNLEKLVMLGHYPTSSQTPIQIRARFRSDRLLDD